MQKKCAIDVSRCVDLLRRQHVYKKELESHQNARQRAEWCVQRKQRGKKKREKQFKPLAEEWRRATMASKQQTSGIVNPHEHDVLSGRGNFVNYHAGNEHFRALVRKHKLEYVRCPKPQKGKFSRMIVDEIKNRTPPGRFLKQDGSTKLWYDIGEKKALDKTRQALREGAPEIMKELNGEGVVSDDEPLEGIGTGEVRGFFFSARRRSKQRFWAELELCAVRSRS